MNDIDSATILLFGGVSSERRVSVASAQMVSRHLPSAALWFWAADGTIHVVSAERVAAFARPFERDFTAEGQPTYLDLRTALCDVPHDAVLLLALHGTGAEDGALQRQCEALGVAYTGTGSAGSAAAFDKNVARELVKAHGLRVAEAVRLAAPWDRALEQTASELLRRHGKLVAKPVADGSSAGLRFIADDAELAALFADLRASGEDVALLLEAFVAGRELTVGVLETETGELRALPCSEVRLAPGRSFDFDGKYLGAGTIELTPAPIDAPLAAAAQEVALTAHRALGCRGYSRTDIIMDATGPVFLETNTLPGLTQASFIPQQLHAADITFAAFLRMQLRVARRARDERRAAALG